MKTSRNEPKRNMLMIKHITTTRGGPSKDIMVTSTDDDIHEIIGTQLTGLSSEFDDDAVMGKGI